jgi:hypothetical protein
MYPVILQKKNCVLVLTISEFGGILSLTILKHGSKNKEVIDVNKYL